MRRQLDDRGDEAVAGAVGVEGLGGEEGIVKGRVEEEDDDSDDDLENAADDEPRCTYLVTDIFLLTVLSFC